MKLLFTILVNTFFITSAYAGSAYQLFMTPDRPDLEICADKIGMGLYVNGVFEKMNRISLDLYESLDKKIKVERARGWTLIDEENQSHVLSLVGEGFGSCGSPDVAKP